MITPAEVDRWTREAEPALRGGFVHRVWRADDAWVLLVRHHEGGDAGERAVSRVAYEIATAADWARCVAIPPEDTDADDKKAKKVQSRDSNPYLALLRKHLAGRRVEAVRALEGERIVQLTCVRDDAGAPRSSEAADDGDELDPHAREVPEGPTTVVLSVELIGRAGNLILTGREDGGGDELRVIGALHAGKGNRPFTPGEPYRLPPPRPPRAGDAPAEDPQPWAGVEPDSATLALGRAVAAAQRAKAEDALQASRHGQLFAAARKAAKRAQGVLEKLERQLEEVERADEYERQGDLIKANLATLERHGKQVTLTEYVDGAPREVTIELDPKTSIQDHMKALYKRARKLRAGEVNVRTRQGETDAELEALRALRDRIQELDPSDEAGLDEAEAELRRRGALPKAKGSKVKQQANQGPRSFRTREGHEVLVGRSDEENDRLTMRVARGNDLFFHVRGCPGSHVILRVDPKRPPNHESLVDAATVAVHYSKARNRGAVDVSYTPRKWVRKPRGAKPGLVQISNEKTVRAGGDPERLQRVLSTSQRGEDE